MKSQNLPNIIVSGIQVECSISCPFHLPVFVAVVKIKNVWNFPAAIGNFSVFVFPPLKNRDVWPHLLQICEKLFCTSLYILKSENQTNLHFTFPCVFRVHKQLFNYITDFCFLPFSDWNISKIFANFCIAWDSHPGCWESERDVTQQRNRN